MINDIAKLFVNPSLDETLLAQIAAIKEPRSRYFIAITPRSGSSYLCDVLSQTKRFGMPQEVIGDVQAITRRLPTMPGRTPEEYLCHVLRLKQSDNGVSGTKASWFQWQNFQACLNNPKVFADFKYIYLTRKDTIAQAVSLYKATESSIFHSITPVNDHQLIKLNELSYSYEKIKFWHTHILVQQQGWQDYFQENNIKPLCLYYEDIYDDILTVLKQIAAYVGVQANNVFLPAKGSVYQKIADARNEKWAEQFKAEYIV